MDMVHDSAVNTLHAFAGRAEKLRIGHKMQTTAQPHALFDQWISGWNTMNSITYAVEPYDDQVH
jgi:hypothetical protein